MTVETYAALAAAGILLCGVWLAWTWTRTWWDAFTRRHARRINQLPYVVGGTLIGVVGVSEVARTTGIAFAVIILVLILWMIAAAFGVRPRRRRRLNARTRPAGTPTPPIARNRPGVTSGLYWIEFGDRHRPGVSDWIKVGMGQVDKRIAVHTTAVGHPQLAVGRIYTTDHVALERTVKADLRQWKINQPGIPGEELFEPSEQVRWYLREFTRTAGGTIRERNTR